MQATEELPTHQRPSPTSRVRNPTLFPANHRLCRNNVHASAWKVRATRMHASPISLGTIYIPVPVPTATATSTSTRFYHFDPNHSALHTDGSLSPDLETD